MSEAPRVAGRRRRSWTADRNGERKRTWAAEVETDRARTFSPPTCTGMTHNPLSMPCLWSAHDDHDERGEGDGVRRHVSRAFPSMLLLPAPLAGPSCGRTPAAWRTPARVVRGCPQEIIPPSSQVRTPSSSNSSSAEMKTPSQQARGSFAVPLSPITPSTRAPSSSTSSSRVAAAAAGPSALETPSARSSSFAGATTTSRRFSHVRSRSAPSEAAPFAHRAPPPYARGTPPPHRRSAPRRLASMPAEAQPARGRPTAAGTPEGTPELSTPVMASLASFGDVDAAASAVPWTGSGSGGGGSGSEGDEEDATADGGGGVGGGGYMDWDFDELDYGVDRGPAVRGRPVRLLKIFGSETDTHDSEDNFETGEGEDHGDGKMFGLPAVPATLSEASLNPRSVGVNGIKQQVPSGFLSATKRQEPSGFRSAGTTGAVAGAVAGAGAGSGADYNDVDIAPDDDGEVPALPTVAAADSSYRNALSAKEDEDNSRGSLRPRSAPRRPASVARDNDDFGGGGGGGVEWGDAAAVRLLPRTLGVPTCDNNRSSSPMQFGAGTDYEVLIPGGGGGGGGAEEMTVLVSAPPRLRRLRFSADGSLFESDARRPPIYRRKRRNHIRQPSHGDEPDGGGGSGAPPATATTHSSICADMQQRKCYPNTLLDSSSDEEEDEDTTRILGRVPPKHVQAGSTSDSGGGTPGGTLGGALKSPGAALRTPTYSSSAHANAARVKSVVRGPSREDQPAETREFYDEKEAEVQGGTMQGRRESAPNQEAGVEAGQEAGMVHRRRKSAPITHFLAPLRLRSGSFAHDLVIALECLDQPEEAEEEDRRRRQQKIDQRDQPDSASAAQQQQQQQRGRGRYKKRSTSLSQRPWSRPRGQSWSGGGGSGTNSRRGSGTSGGGGSKRGSEILGKIKGMLSLEPRQSSPAVRPMSRIELHKAQLAAEAVRSPGTRLASSSCEDEPCPEDEPGRRGNTRVPGWRSRSRGAPGVGGGGCREIIIKLQ